VVCNNKRNLLHTILNQVQLNIKTSDRTDIKLRNCFPILGLFYVFAFLFPENPSRFFSKCSNGRNCVRKRSILVLYHNKIRLLPVSSLYPRTSLFERTRTNSKVKLYLFNKDLLEDQSLIASQKSIVDYVDRLPFR
jgi:hypothetical protein